MTELTTKLGRIHHLLDEQQLDGLLLRRASSFAWATGGGAAYVNTASTAGEAALLVTRQERYLVTNNVEAPRLEQEEGLAGQGWQFHVAPWHAPADPLAGLTRGLRLGADLPYPGAADLSVPVARLRAWLTPEEGERFQVLGRLCAQAMDAAARAVRPGQSEHEIAALLAAEAQGRGVQPIVNLIATDGRVSAYRHPLPTARRLEQYAMLVLCGRRHGLVCSLTRLVHFGPLPADLRRKAAAVATIDAALIAATRPGRTLGEIFDEGVRHYARAGFPDEWRLHHQGGTAGYEPREFVARPGLAEPVRAGQTYAWNPSITGVKSEDTILIGEQGYEIISAVDGWPVEEVSLGGQVISRPSILQLPALTL